MPSYRRCASAETCALSAAISRPASSAAAPKPTASGAGTVPLRRPRSCGPFMTLTTQGLGQADQQYNSHVI